MARETLYVVQAYVAGPYGGLKAEPATGAKSAAAAVMAAERLGSSKLGVVAFATSGDPETGDYDERPQLLFKIGQVPEQFSD